MMTLNYRPKIKKEKKKKKKKKKKEKEKEKKKKKKKKQKKTLNYHIVSYNPPTSVHQRNLHRNVIESEIHAL